MTAPRRRVDTRGTIRDGDAGPYRALAGQAGDRHQAAHALDDLIHRGAIDVGPVLAEAGDTDDDQARIDACSRSKSIFNRCFTPRTEVLEEHVGRFHEPVEDLEPSGLFRSSDEAAFTPVKVLEVRSVPQPGQALSLCVLDHHHVSAPVGEVAYRRRPRPGLGQVEHPETGEGQFRRRRVGCHRPRKAGCRFSKKAARPSWRSALARQARIRRSGISRRSPCCPDPPARPIPPADNVVDGRFGGEDAQGGVLTRSSKSAGRTRSSRASGATTSSTKPTRRAVVGFHAFSGEEDQLGRGRADQGHEVPHGVQRVAHAEPGRGYPDADIAGGDAEIGLQRHRHTAAQAPPAHHGDQGLAERFRGPPTPPEQRSRRLPDALRFPPRRRGAGRYLRPR